MGNTYIQPTSSSLHSAFKTKHPHLGNIEQCTHPQHGKCYKKIQNFADEMTAQQKYRRLSTRIKKYKTIKYILQVKALQMYKKDEMCAHNYDLHVFMEPFAMTLRELIAQKIKAKKNCSQNEILEFLKQTIDALIYLQDNGFKNCHLDKESLLICEESQCMKIVDLSLAEETPYHRLVDSRNSQRTSSSKEVIKNLYVAPQLLKQLKENNYDPFVSPKSDVFSLGMLALELACLEELDNYYDYRNCEIDYDSLIHRVSRIVYSVELKTLLAGMLQYEPDLRLGLISLQEKVYQLLHINQQATHLKRSRSSSTKMLKQLLTQSRRSSVKKCLNTSSQENSQVKQSNSIIKRKNSHSSITSMASLNSRLSGQKQLNIGGKASNMGSAKKNVSFQKQLIYSFKGDPTLKTEAADPSFLKNMVKNKTSATNKNLEVKGLQKNQNNSNLCVNNWKNAYNKTNNDKKKPELENFKENIENSYRANTQNSAYKNPALNNESNTSKLSAEKPQFTSSYLNNIKNLYTTKSNSSYNHHNPHIPNSTTSSQNFSSILEQNNQNSASSNNKYTANLYKESISYGSRPFFSQYPSYLQSFSSPQTLEITPKAIQHGNQKQNQSIFKLIEESYCSSNKNNSKDQESFSHINSNAIVQNFMKKKSKADITPNNQGQPNIPEKPIQTKSLHKTNSKKSPKNTPKIDQFQENPHNSSPLNYPESNTNKKSSQEKAPIIQPQEHNTNSKNQSVSLRVKHSLDNMYKTIKSITSSEEKSEMRNFDYEESIVERQFRNIEEYRSAKFCRKIQIENGYIYEGELNEEEMPEGNGILYCLEDSRKPHEKFIIYNGEWQNGLYQGAGSLYNIQNKIQSKNPSEAKIQNLSWNKPLQIKYLGEFKKGMKEGYGTTYYTCGSKFEGQMKNDKANGRGCFVDGDGKTVSGEWENNQLVEILD